MGISAGEVATASDVRKLEMICENQTFTRVLSAAGGDVAYTGYGFTPKALIAYAHTPTPGAARIDYGTNWGNYASTHSCFRIAQTTSSDWIQEFSSTRLISLFSGSSSNGQFASVKSLDADGFTLTWTKEGTPTPTADISIMAIGDGT